MSAFPSQRLYSLDALRGFDMFWIMGAEEIINHLAEIKGGSFWKGMASQLTHPDWNGFHLYDLIFPLFLFLAGVAVPYSVGAGLEKGQSRNTLFLRIMRRGLILVLIGILYNNGLKLQPLADMRLPSVLGRIGLAYMFAGIIYLYTSQRGQIIWFWGILVAYWCLLLFNSAPGFPMGDLTMEGNFASYLDRMLVPGKLYLNIHDPEGLVSTLPAIATGLLGIYAGNILKNSPLSQIKKVLLLAGLGTVFVLLAQLWNLTFPINKNLWTSSFVLQTGGLSLLLLSLFYYIIDVQGYRRWAFFFTIIGMNSILIYVSGSIINWSFAIKGLFEWFLQIVGNPYDIVAYAILYVLVKWLFLYFLYRNKVFLRV